jgi:pimeloyl-ACP methyl ester carboxylesterase
MTGDFRFRILHLSSVFPLLIIVLLTINLGDSFLTTNQLQVHQSACASIATRHHVSSTYDTDQLDLPSGVSAQVLSSFPSSKKNNRPPLVFVHGSFHSAWCWCEHWMDYFVERGYPVIALSLRGTGGTFAGEGVTKVKIDEHAADIQAFLSQADAMVRNKTSGGEDDAPPPFWQSIVDSISSSESPGHVKPVLISHSFGGAAVMKYMETFPDELIKLSGAITLCSVPPSGLGPMTMRFIRGSLIQSWKIIAGFALKKCFEKADLCRDLFFGGPKIEEAQEDGSVATVDDNGVSDEDIARYQGYFRRDTAATIDAADFVKQLPSKQWDENRRAPFLSKLPPCLVIGADRDYLIDKEGTEETANYFGVEAQMIDSPHDVMIGSNWKEGAGVIYEWLQANGM